MAAALEPPAAALAAWQEWGRRRSAPLTPIAQRWLPLVGWNLRSAVVDEESAALFRTAHRETWASNQRLVEEARPGIEALRSSGIRIILLKGTALGLSLYESPGLRAIGDVDLLVDLEQADRAEALLGTFGWQPLRRRHALDRRMVQAADLRRPPHGALDLHWYLLRECCWPGVDRGMWERAEPLASWPGMLTLSPADQLLHSCIHGLRWSLVQDGRWIADAARVIQSARPSVDWDVVVDEARRRQLGLQMAEAMRLVRRLGHVPVPDSAIDALAALPVAWNEGWECRLKGRPVVSVAGLFVVWSGWLRIRRGSRAAGVAPPPWPRYLAAAIGVETSAALVKRLARHAGALLRGTAA